jgi:hypothetical protein
MAAPIEHHLCRPIPVRCLQGWDDPDQTLSSGERGAIADGFANKLKTLEKSLTIESAYFVVGDKGVEGVHF